jgi:hypothetical protein
MTRLVKEMAPLAGLHIQFKRPDPQCARFTDKTCRGIDGARRPNADKQVGAIERGIYFLHPVWHLAKPNDIGA